MNELLLLCLCQLLIHDIMIRSLLREERPSLSAFARYLKIQGLCEGFPNLALNPNASHRTLPHDPALGGAGAAVDGTEELYLVAAGGQ